MSNLWFVVSGVAAAWCFPNGWFPRWQAWQPFLIWAAFIPLLVSGLTFRPSLWRSAGMGWVTGTIFFMMLLSWMTRAQASLFWSSVGWITLCAYLGLSWGVFALAVSIGRRSGPWCFSLGAGAAWAWLEWVRERLMTGFPWGELGYTQTPHGWVGQWASVFGVVGLSLMIVWGNAWLAWHLVHRPRDGRGWARVGGQTLGIALCVLGGGWFLQQRTEMRAQGLENTLGVAMLQGNVSQAKKMDLRLADENFRVYEDLAQSAIRNSQFAIEMMVWPETASPTILRNDPAFRARLERLARNTGAAQLVGTVDYDAEWYNAAWFVNADGAFGGCYRKHRLIPGGEFVPLSGWGIFDRISTVKRDYAAGSGTLLLTLVGQKGQGIRIGPSIYYEATFSDFAIRQVREGAEILINMTNDEWYGPSALPLQHVMMAKFRAVETGRWLVRLANTGISVVVNPRGETVAEIPEGRSGVEVVRVGLSSDVTPHVRWGGWWPWVWGAGALWWLATGWRDAKSYRISGIGGV